VSRGRVKLTLTVKEEQERTISKGGNTSLLYLPKEYFTPGEKVNSQLEIDSDGNLKMVLTKKLFNFTCDNINTLIGTKFNVEFDKIIAGTRIFSATQDSLTLNCTKSTRDLEPTNVTVSKQFNKIHSPDDYLKLKDLVKKLAKKDFEAYIEPEGDLDSINIYKNPQRYKLKDESEAIEALNATGKKIGFSLIIRFNSKRNTADQIKDALKELAT
jgi:hypothetical protein